MPDPLRIVIEVDNQAAKSAIAETNKQLDGLTNSSTRSAQNTTNVFQRMATQIAQSVKSIGGTSNTGMFQSIEESARLAGTGAANSMRGMVANITASLRGLDSTNGSFLNISSGAEAAAAKATAAMAEAAAKMKAELSSVSGEIVVNARANATGGAANGGNAGVPMPGVVAGRQVPKTISDNFDLGASEWDIRKMHSQAQGLWRAGEANEADYHKLPKDAQFSADGTAQFNSAIAMKGEATSQMATVAEMRRNQKEMADEHTKATEELEKSNEAAGESFAGSMLKAMAFFAVLQEGVTFLKDWTVGAVEGAAHVDKMATAMTALGRVNGITSDGLEKAVQSVKKIGFTTEESIAMINRAVAGGLGAGNAVALSQIAKNAAAATGTDAETAAVQMDQYLQTGTMPRGLRRAGLNPQVDTKGMSEDAAELARFNALKTESARIDGVAAAAMTTASGQMEIYNRSVVDAKEALGEGFIPVMGTLINFMREGADSTKAHIGEFKTMISIVLEVAAAVAVLVGTYKVLAGAAKLFEAAQASIAAGAAALSGPIGWISLAVAAIAAFGVGWLLTRDKTDVATQAINQSRKALDDEKKQLDLTNDSLEKRNQLLDFETRKKSLDTQDRINELEKQKASAMGQYDLAKSRVDNPTQATASAGSWGSVRQFDVAAETAKMAKAKKDFNDANDQIKSLMPPVQAAPASKPAAPDTKGIDEYTRTVESLREAVAKAQADELTGYKKLNVERDNELEKLRQKHQLTQLTLGLVNEELAAKIRGESRKDAGKFVEGFEADRNTDAKNSNSKFSAHLAYSGETDKLDADSVVKDYDESVKRSIEFSRNMQLESLRTIDAQSLSGKLAVEQKKFAIEQEYLVKSSVAQIDAIRIQTEGQVALLEVQRDSTKDEQAKADITQRISTVQNVAARQAAAIQDVFLNSSEAAQAASINNQTEIVQAGITKQFETFKQASSGVFDALLVKGETVWQALANSLKNAFLTVMKEVVTSTVAKQLTGIFTPQSAGAATSGGTMGKVQGWWSTMTSAPRAQASQRPIGTTPPFIDNGVDVGAYDPEDPGAQYNRFIDAPASMVMAGAAAIPSVSQQANGGFMGKLGGLFGKGGGLEGLAGMFGIKNSGIGKILQTGSNSTVPMDVAGIGDWGKALGHSNAAVLGGGMLAMDGWSRGGGMGMLETTAGGAMIGNKYGGTLGAAIGAGVGALVGGLHWAFGAGSPEEQMQKHVKELTGVTIDDKSFLSNMVAACKQATGGDIVSFIKSKAGADMVESYASQTKQKYANPYDHAQFNMQLSGGTTYEQASYTNGSINSSLSSLPGTGFSDVSTLGSGAPTSTTLSLDAAATTAVLTGQAASVIQGNPRMVAASNNAALAQNYGTAAIGAVGNATSIKP